MSRRYERPARRDWCVWVVVAAHPDGDTRFHLAAARGMPDVCARLVRDGARLDVIMVQAVPDRRSALAVLHGLDEALIAHRVGEGAYRFNLEASADKATFHAACKAQFDRYVGPNWRWRQLRFPIARDECMP